MKKTLNFLSMILLAIVLLPSVARAQQQQIPPMGIDSEVKIGKLPNGLTYYIRHNEYPKGQADFYIAQKVGSILEDDNQRGLAHFLEHMCFNGTTHFPGKNLINWLESVGVKFGYNLNAKTGVDMTLYNISNVPVTREGVQDSCLLILHDWANDLLLLPEEIDAERGVIHEEWRRSNVGSMRIYENLLPTIYPNSPYGYRLPIGTMEVVDNFKPQALRDYYEKWYRPDLQGIIVVGDIDVNRIEAKIKEMFSDIEMPENPAERVYFPVADNDGTIYAIGHDKEQTNNIVQLNFKTEALPDQIKPTMFSYVQDFVTTMISDMLNTRLTDISSKPNAPFTNAGVYYSDFFLAKTKDAFTLVTVANDAASLPSALAASYREVLRAARGGFTHTEFDRAKSEYLSQAEKAYNNAATRRNEQFALSYVSNFLDNDPIPSAEEEYQTIQMIANSVPLEQINMTFAQLITDNNRVLIALMGDTPDNVYPTEQQFAAAIQSVDAEEIEPYKEEVKTEPLVEKLYKAGKIKRESTDDQWGTTVWYLDNGATVIIKNTDFKKDEILFAAQSKKGTAKYGAAYANSLTFAPAALRSALGLGTYTSSDLEKYLAGKQAGVSPSLGLYTTSFSGHSTPKDLPTLMELIYMNFTAPNLDPEEYQSLQGQYVTMLQNQMSNPEVVFNEKLIASLYNSPRIQMLTPEIVNSANRQQILEVYKAMTSNAADFTFTFVGNVTPEQLRPLVEKYIASLPGNSKKAVTKIDTNYPQYLMIGGDQVNTYSMPMQTPQTYIYLTTFGDMDYTTKNAQLASYAGQIISNRLLNKIREEMGAVYSIGASGSMDRIGTQNAEIATQFPMKPEMKEEVLKEIRKIFEDMTNNVTQEEVDKVKEFMIKNYTEAKEVNGSWLGAISGWLTNGVDTFHPAIEVSESITPADVMQYVTKLLAQRNYRVVVLDPAAE